MLSLIATFKLNESFSTEHCYSIIRGYRISVGFADERPAFYLGHPGDGLMSFIDDPLSSAIEDLIEADYQENLHLEVLSLLKRDDESVEVLAGLYLGPSDYYETEFANYYYDNNDNYPDCEPSKAEIYEEYGIDYHRIDLGDHVEYHMDVGGYIIDDEGEYVDPEDYRREHYRRDW